jgi:hypothetical protein
LAQRGALGHFFYLKFFVEYVILKALMALSWARQRQLNHILTVLVFLALVGFVLFLIYKPVPNCFDNKQNQNEQGIDCGGVCSLACISQIQPLRIDWVRPLKVESGWYDLVAQVENLNPTLGNRSIPYTFSVYDGDNVLITKREGSTFVNAGEKFVIFESRVTTGERDVGKAFLEFPTSTPWETISPVAKDILIERREFTNTPKPVLHLSISNSSLKVIKDISVITVLSDINNNAFAASQTKIDNLEPSSRQETYFTWLTPFISDPSYIESYWRINTFNFTK